MALTKQHRRHVLQPAALAFLSGAAARMGMKLPCQAGNSGHIVCRTVLRSVTLTTAAARIS